MDAYALVAISVCPGGPEGQVGVFATHDQAERHAEKLAAIDPHVVSPDSKDAEGYVLQIVALPGIGLPPEGDRRRDVIKDETA